jgi:hypothetical protein
MNSVLNCVSAGKKETRASIVNNHYTSVLLLSFNIAVVCEMLVVRNAHVRDEKHMILEK